MSGAHEIAEKIEHAAHGGHGGAGVGRLAGITMAILGVMLALCAAMVGGARTELITTMVEQSDTWQKYQAQRMKHRLMLTQLATLNALSPSHAELKKFQDELARAPTPSGKTSSDDSQDIKAAVEASTRALVEILTPRAEEMARLVGASKRYEQQVEAAQEWAESYDEAVHAFSEASEHYEWGQLSAEIGIVIASIALLLSSKKAWYTSVVFGSICALVLSWTFATTRIHAHHAEEEIAKHKAVYQKLRKDKASAEEDEETIKTIELAIKGMPAGAAAEPSEAHAHH